jgi:hypothetical protein
MLKNGNAKGKLIPIRKILNKTVTTAEKNQIELKEKKILTLE